MSYSLRSTPMKSDLKKGVQSSKSPNILSDLKTPDKQPAAPPLRRGRSRAIAFSLKEVRQAAQTPSQQHPNEKIKTVRRQIASWPDEDTAVLKPKKKINESHKLPIKYEMLAEFYDSLDNSLRLLRLKGSITSFTNICPKIECFTDRRFSLNHLAQLKYILPEAIEIKRVLLFDERTSCMKPDLQVMINVDSIEFNEKSKCESKNVELRKIFRCRLLDFSKSHPQETDIPEAELPEPFNQRRPDLNSENTKVLLPVTTQTCESFKSTEATETQRSVVASHLSGSFRRHFSHKVLKSTKDADVNCSDRLLLCSSLQTPKKAMQVAIKEDCGTKVNDIVPTPVKSLSTPARLVTATSTPALRPPKKSYMSPDCDSPNKLVRRLPRTRSLKFDKVEKVDDEVNNMKVDSVDDDIHDILPASLLQSIREKELKILHDQDPAISQAKRRRQMIACLPKLFNTIHFLFQSIKRSVITKEELIHKIIASPCDIIDRREVQEQLKLLLELTPEWITEKLISSGDLLVCINKMSSPEAMRSRLEEAK